MTSFGKSQNIKLMLLATLFLFACKKDEPSISQMESFIKSYGYVHEDEAKDFIKDNGNYFLLGNVNTNSDFDSTKICLVKTDEYGNSLWNGYKTYPNRSLNKNTFAEQIIKLSNNSGFAIIGSIEVDNDSLFLNSYLAIISNDGEILKDTVFYFLDTTSVETNESGVCIGELDDGNLLIGLNITNANNNNYINSYFLNISPDFEINRVIPRNFRIRSLHRRNHNSGFYCLGRTDEDPGILSIKGNGDLVAIIPHHDINGEIYSIIENSDNETFICGAEDYNNNGRTDGFIAKLADPEWKYETVWKTYYNNQLISKNAEFKSIDIDNSNNIVIVGSIQNSQESDDNFDIWVLKTDNLGKILSEDIIGGSYDEKGVKIISSNENFVVQATTYLGKNSMISLLKSNFK